jgi:hypothetical protein
MMKAQEEDSIPEVKAELVDESAAPFDSACKWCGPGALPDNAFAPAYRARVKGDADRIVNLCKPHALVADDQGALLFVARLRTTAVR